MVKVRAQNLNRNTVKRRAENSQKISSDDSAVGIMSLVRHQEFKAAERSWIRPGVIGLLWHVVYPAEHEHFFVVALTIVPFEFRPRPFTIKF